jgi:hypothetical protein
MLRALRVLQLLQWSMLISIVLYVFVGEFVHLSMKPVNPSASYMFTTLAVALIGIIFVVRRTLVVRPAASLSAQPEDTVSLHQWRTGYILTYALCEALAFLGLVQRLLGGSLQQSAPYYIGGFALMLFFWPRQPEKVS